MNENENKPELVFDINGTPGGRLRIEFADGLREIPAHVIEEIGEETLNALAPKLRGVTYGTFYAKLSQRKQLNLIQAGMIADHFGKSF